MILDLGGYSANADLTAGRAIEPAVGGGAFLGQMVERLLESADRLNVPPGDLGPCIRAFDIQPTAVAASRAVAARILSDHSVLDATIEYLTTQWVRQADFLDEASSLKSARWLFGNPPFVRIEDLDPTNLARYRAKWSAMKGRADLYVGFLQAGLQLLEPGGSMVVICADRWMRNQYGSALRELVADRFNMRACVEFQEVDAFEDKVAAYPAITHISREDQGRVLVSEAFAGFGPSDAKEVADIAATGVVRSGTPARHRSAIVETWFTGSASWPSGHPEELAWLAKAQTRLGTLAMNGVRIGTGIATGADAAFLVSSPGLIERDRLVPAVGAQEVSSGSILWRGRWLVNPWSDDETLIRLEDYPGASEHFAANAVRVKGRHVAQKNPDKWWRTIDKIPSGLLGTQKLLIPDLKDRIFPVLDSGKFLPLHSLCYVTSDVWDLEVLGALLMSQAANRFIRGYSVRMANGYRRASAQYLRRVLIPNYACLDAQTRSALASAFRSRDMSAVDALCGPLYQAALSDDPDDHASVG